MFFFILLLAMPVAAWWYMFKPFNEHKNEVQGHTLAQMQKLSDLRKMTAKPQHCGGY